MRNTRKYSMSEYDLELDEENSMDADSGPARNDHDSGTAQNDHNSADEDTEDASETDMVKQEEEYTEIKEQMYQDKLSNLKKQLKQLKEGTHPEYQRKLKKLQAKYENSILQTKCFVKYMKERIEKEHREETASAIRDFEEKKVELKEHLIAELEEKNRMIELERTNMELTGDSMDVKPVTTRKLRRRPNDPLPLPEKRRKQYPTQINFLLDENEIADDLKVLNKGKLARESKRHEVVDSFVSSEGNTPSVEVRVEDGKLYYDKKWYHRGQPIYYDGKDVGSKIGGVICTISSTEIWVKKVSDNSKVRIHISQLQKGKYTIRRRSS